MKIQWNKFRLYGDIAKRNELPVENAQEQIANAVLQQGQGIAAYDLAQKIYNDDGDVEYTDKEQKVIKGLLDSLPTMWAVALKEIIE